MKKIVFVTNNTYKICEVAAITKGKIDVIGLKDIGFEGEIPETADTIEGNALLKANHIFDRYQIDCFADDTGLEVEALNGAPGVYSARYAGENATYNDNTLKLLSALKNLNNRNARFKTVIALRLNEKTYLFEGTVKGKIIEHPRGLAGFGYDPVFVPDGYEQSFAEMSSALKNNISHRGIATQKLIAFLLQMAQ